MESTSLDFPKGLSYSSGSDGLADSSTLVRYEKKPCPTARLFRPQRQNTRRAFLRILQVYFAVGFLLYVLNKFGHRMVYRHPLETVQSCQCVADHCPNQPI